LHSPGQLVIYPIINIKKRNITVNAYVRLLEDWIVKVLGIFGIDSGGSDRGVGIWSNEKKIGFVGIHIGNGITSHGLSLNVSNDLNMFNSIIPCGLKSIQITSILDILKKKVSISSVAEVFKKTSPF
jgi:lipoate-protein ligase B